MLRLNDLRLRARLLTGFGVVLAFLVLNTLVGLVAISNVGVWGHVAGHAARATEGARAAQSGALLFQMTGQDSLANEALASLMRADSQFAEVDATLDDDSLRAQVGGARKAIIEYRDALQKLVVVRLAEDSLGKQKEAQLG
jgi:hypothetical protein